MRSKNYGINVRVTEQEKQKLLENARFCSLSLSEYLRRLGLGKEVRADIAERDYRLFRMLNGLKAELPQLQKEEIISRLEAILNELKYQRYAVVDFTNDNALTVRDEGDRMELPTKRVKEGVSCRALLSLERLLKKLKGNPLKVRLVRL